MVVLLIFPPVELMFLLYIKIMTLEKKMTREMKLVIISSMTIEKKLTEKSTEHFIIL